MTYDPRIGSLLAALGRGGDTMVAHINPEEAALLKALGGSGKINPQTGLPEFDGGGGDSSLTTQAPPQTPQQSALEAQFGPGFYYDQAVSSGEGGGGAVPTSRGPLPDGVAPIDPAQYAQYASMFATAPGGGDRGGGITSPLNRYGEASFDATPGNPNFSIDPVTGYATLTPAGTAALQQNYANEDRGLQANAARNAQGIGAYLGTPMGGLSLPLGVLGLGTGLSALGAVPEIAGAAAGAEAAGAGAAVGADAAGAAGAPFIGAAGSQSVDLGLEAAMAADLPSAGAGAATAGGAGLFGGATPELAGATLATSGLGAAQVGDGALEFAMAADNPSIGAAGATTAGAGSFGFSPELASLGLSDVTAGGGMGASLSSSSGAEAPFIGATSSQAVDPATVGTAGGAGAGGGLGSGGASTGTLGLDAPASAGTVAPTEAQLASGPIEGTSAGGGFLDKAGGLFDKGLNWIGDHPLNALSAGATAIGLGKTLLGGNTNPPQQAALQGQANSLTAQGQSIANSVLSGNNPLPGAQQLQATATQLQQKSQELLAQVQAGNLPNVGAPQLLAQANLAAQQAATLHSYLMTGTLPPGIQGGVDSAAAAAKASIRSAYASRGMSGSSSEAQDVANVDVNKASKGAEIAMQLYAQGTTESQIADGVYTSLVNASTSVMQLGLTEESLGLQAQQQVTQNATNLLNFALNSTQLGANISQTLLNEALREDQQLQQSLANFAAALAGGAGKTATINVNGSQVSTV